MGYNIEYLDPPQAIVEENKMAKQVGSWRSSLKEVCLKAILSFVYRSIINNYKYEVSPVSPHCHRVTCILKGAIVQRSSEQLLSIIVFIPVVELIDLYVSL